MRGALVFLLLTASAACSLFASFDPPAGSAPEGVDAASEAAVTPPVPSHDAGNDVANVADGGRVNLFPLGTFEDEGCAGWAPAYQTATDESVIVRGGQRACRLCRNLPLSSAAQTLTTTAALQLKNLPPGRYRFEVWATKPPSDAGANLSIAANTSLGDVIALPTTVATHPTWSLHATLADVYPDSGSDAGVNISLRIGGYNIEGDCTIIDDVAVYNVTPR